MMEITGAGKNLEVQTNKECQFPINLQYFKWKKAEIKRINFVELIRKCQSDDSDTPSERRAFIIKAPYLLFVLNTMRAPYFFVYTTFIFVACIGFYNNKKVRIAL